MNLNLSTDYALECRTLACLFEDSHHWEQISLVSDELFLYPKNKLFLGIIKRMHEKGSCIGDYVLIQEEATHDEWKALGGHAGLNDLRDGYSLGFVLENMLLALRKLAKMRHFQESLMNAWDELDGEGLEQTKRTLSTRLESIEDGNAGSWMIGDQLEAFLADVTMRREHLQRTGEPYRDGLASGWTKLDEHYTLMAPGRFTVIAGRTSMGKTAFIMNLASQVATNLDISVAVVSLEMSAAELLRRLVCLKLAIPHERLEKGDIDDATLASVQAGTEQLSRRLHIIDNAVTQIDVILAQLTQLVKLSDIGLVVVDYLQLLTTGMNLEYRQQDVAECSRRLKSLAMALKVPVVAAAQLSRKVEERNSKKPILSDLRDSGQIEQDADVVGLLYRADYYDVNDKINQIQVNVAKNRHGPTGEVWLKFEKNLGRISDLDPLKR